MEAERDSNDSLITKYYEKVHEALKLVLDLAEEEAIRNGEHNKFLEAKEILLDYYEVK